MSFLPKTAVGILGLFIFVGWLANEIINNPQFGLLDSVTSLTTDSLANIQSLEDTGTSNGIFGFASDIISIVFNMFLLIFGILLFVPVSLETFLLYVLMLPPQISLILTVLFSVGAVFTLIKLLVPDA